MTKKEFLEEYSKQLKSRYTWAADEAKLDRFMKSVEATITIPKTNTWNANGEAVTAAWKAIGGQGIPSLLKLRNLK